jgi:subtilisin family serine protease
MKRLILLVSLVADSAVADSKTIGFDGIDSKSTGLDGSLDPFIGVNIGEADALRSAKAGYDDLADSAPNTIPFGVYFQSTGSMAGPGSSIGNHATEVAGVMIGSAMPNPTYEGVAPRARLHSIGLGDLGDDSLAAVGLQSLALLNVTPEVKAINISFGSQPGFNEDDGRSILSQFIDWSTVRHEVLYVISGARDFEPTPRGKPDDNFNGITVGASDLDDDGEFYSTFADSNAVPDFAGGERSYIDILAPGDHVQVYGAGASQHIRFGTSYAAPHVTGAVALLEQYRDQQARALNERFFGGIEPVAYKAILMNSADKLAGVQGSSRDVTNQLGQKWDETLAYIDDNVPLDSGMGAGHLNVRRAVQQFSAGRHQFTGELSGETVPLVAWAETLLLQGRPTSMC